MARKYSAREVALIVDSFEWVLSKEHDQVESKIAAALDTIQRYGGIDGGHHKQWVIDQVVRCLVTDYPQWVKEQKDGEDGPATYDWDEGIPP